MKLDRNGRRGAQNVPTRGLKGSQGVEFPKPTATLIGLWRIKSCLSCIWAGYPIDRHDESDWGR
eukprot:2368054-Prymnesium_polylepis.1